MAAAGLRKGTDQPWARMKEVLPKVSRRQFIQGAAAAAAVWPQLAAARQAASPSRVFRHGVASGDPLPDRVISGLA